MYESSQIFPRMKTIIIHLNLVRQGKLTLNSKTSTNYCIYIFVRRYTSSLTRYLWIFQFEIKFTNRIISKVSKNVTIRRIKSNHDLKTTILDDFLQNRSLKNVSYSTCVRRWKSSLEYHLLNRFRCPTKFYHLIYWLLFIMDNSLINISLNYTECTLHIKISISDCLRYPILVVL